MYLNKQQSISLLGISIWLIAVVFFLYEFFLRVFIGTLADQIIPDLHLTVTTFAMIGTAYNVAYGIMQVPVGLLVDRFGVRKILSFATLVCAGSVFLFTSAHQPWLAVFSRLLMGFGSSFAFVCLLVIISTWFNRRNFGFMAGLSQFIGTIGPLLAGGPLVSLLSHSNGDWRLILNKIGLAGILLFISVLLVVKNNTRRETSQLVILQPKIPVLTILRQLLQNRQAWLIAIYSAAIYVPISVMGAIWGTTYLETLSFTQAQSAGIISTTWLGYAVGCITLGLYSDRSRRRKSTMVLCSLIGLVSTVFIIFVNLKSIWVYHCVFFGLGIAASGQNVGFAAMAEHVTPSTRASALGLNNSLIVVLDAAIQLSVSVIINMITGKTGHPLAHSFTIGFSILPALYFSALVISVVYISETYCKPIKELIILKPRLASS